MKKRGPLVVSRVRMRKWNVRKKKRCLGGNESEELLRKRFVVDTVWDMLHPASFTGEYSVGLKGNDENKGIGK